MSINKRIHTFMFILFFNNAHLEASETLLDKITQHASSATQHADQKPFEQMIWSPSTEQSYPVYNFFKGLLLGKQTTNEQQERKQVFNHICESLYAKHFLIADSVEQANNMMKDKLYITLAFCQYTYFFPYEHAGFILEYYNNETKEIESAFYELTFKSWLDAFKYAFMGHKEGFQIFKKNKESIVASFCMHPNLSTPDKVRWYPYKTFEAEYNSDVLKWLSKLAQERYIPYSFFGTKSVDENDEIKGCHNCISFTLEVLKKLNIFNATTLGELLSYSYTYSIAPSSIFHPFHHTIAHDLFWLPESLKRLVDDTEKVKKKRKNEFTQHEAEEYPLKRPAIDKNARVTVEKKIKQKVMKAFVNASKEDITKKKRKCTKK